MMASSSSLPAQHPHLALHLTDRALTPIISTSLPPSSSSSSQLPDNAVAAAAAAASASSSRATFTTSPPSSPDSPSSPSTPPELPSATALSLAHLTNTALTSYQTAKRLTHGAPLRTMIEYPAPRGPVVLHSYLCPMSLALGTPGVRPRRSSSQGSLTTAAGGGGAAPEGDAANNGLAPAAQDDEDNDDDDSDIDVDNNVDSREEPDVPMLIATVVAPAAQDLKDARRAAGRLERVAKAVQTEWIAQGPATNLPTS